MTGVDVFFEYQRRGKRPHWHLTWLGSFTSREIKMQSIEFILPSLGCDGDNYAQQQVHHLVVGVAQAAAVGESGLVTS
jgi:hypothetical protein